VLLRWLQLIAHKQTLAIAPKCANSHRRFASLIKPVLGLSVNRFYTRPQRSNGMDDAAYKKFREILIGVRKTAGLTQAELSQRLNRPQSFVSKYERGERRLDVVEFGAVAKALSADPVKLLEKFYRGAQ
jgi:ribosome-binding protein aMBF1 (putative translation factor)